MRTLTDSLAEEAVTITEVLRTAGYRTLAVVTNQVLTRERGLARGFDLYDVAADGRRAAATTDTALSLLAEADPSRPLFAWVHYVDPHVPYHPAADVAAAFDPEYTGRFGLHFGRSDGGAYEPFPLDLPKATATHRNPLGASVNAHVRRLYAADIHGVDAEVGRLVGALRGRGDPLVVLTADHGESLGEHAFFWDHGDYVYNASTRVPLAFVLPTSHPLHADHVAGRCSAWVSLVDVVPTLLELLEIQAPDALSAQLEGRSLVPCFGGPLADRPVFLQSGRAYYPELVARRRRPDLSGGFRGVIAGDWKLIFTPYAPAPDAFELYDLASDPDEERDLYRQGHPRAELLRAELDRFLDGEDASAPTRPPSPEDLETLRALGYVE